MMMQFATAGVVAFAATGSAAFILGLHKHPLFDYAVKVSFVLAVMIVFFAAAHITGVVLC